MSENDINDLRPQNEKTTFYYKHCMPEILCDFGTICFNIIFFTQIAVAFDTLQQQQSWDAKIGLRIRNYCQSPSFRILQT